MSNPLQITNMIMIIDATTSGGQPSKSHTTDWFFGNVLKSFNMQVKKISVFGTAHEIAEKNQPITNVE